MFPLFFWEEYVANQTYYCDKWEDAQDTLFQLQTIKEFLDTHSKFQGCTGEELQEKYNYFEEYFDGIGGLDYSWRAWGQLMAAYMNSKECDRKYTYMDFYMRYM